MKHAFCSLFVFGILACSTLTSAQTEDRQREAINATILEKTCPDDNPDCTGKIIWSDGSAYEGKIEKGQRQGNGRMTYANGEVYEGDWKNNEIGEEGSYIFANGDEYYGSFQKGQVHGEGQMIYSDGHTYSGDWKTGARDGEGTMLRTDKSRFNGRFKDDQREGEGEVIWESGDTLSGIWIEDRLDGKSKFQFSNGDQLICSWDNGNLNVRGTYQLANGKVMKGTLNEIRKEANEQLDMLSDAELNFRRAWLSFATEFKANGDANLAADFLLAAQRFSTTTDECTEVIATELAKIKAEQGTGFARLPLSMDQSN